MNSKLVSVIIPVLNEVGYLRACLDGLLLNDRLGNNLEIIIVDGGSNDGTDLLLMDYIEKYNFIKLLHNENKTVPYAMNLAIEVALGFYIIRIDAHAIYPKNYIGELIRYMELLSADNVGGVLLTRPSAQTLQAKSVARILSHPFGVGNSKFRIGVSEEYVRVDTVPFGCYRRDIFNEIGFYDVMLTRNQDDEFNARLLRSGGKVYLIPSILIEYYSRDTFWKMAIMLYQYGYFKPLVALKIGAPTTIRQLIPPLFVLSLIFSFGLMVFNLKYGVLFILILTMHAFVGLYFSIAMFGGALSLINFYAVIGFLVAHLAYGCGYLLGVYDFLIKKIHLVNFGSKKNISLSR